MIEYRYNKLLARFDDTPCGAYQYKSPRYGYKTAYKYDGLLYIYRTGNISNGYEFCLPIPRHIKKLFLKDLIQAISESKQPNNHRLEFEANCILTGFDERYSPGGYKDAQNRIL